MIEVDVNGVIHEFPEGTSQDVIRSALQRKYAPQPKDPFTPLESAIVGAGNALTFNAIPRMVAGYESFVEGKPYEQSLQRTQSVNKSFNEENPISSIGGSIAGGLLGGAGIGATKAGATLGNMLGSGTTAARIGKGILGGGAIGAAYGAGGAEAGQVMEGAAEGGLLGAAFGGAIPAVSAGIKSVIGGIKGSVDDTTKALARKAVDKYGIDININQLFGKDSPVNNLQRASQALPLSGTEKSLRKQNAQFNKAVSRTFGQDIEDVTMDAIDGAFDKAGKPFNDILSGKKIQVSPNLEQELNSIIDDASQNIEIGKVEIIRKNAQRVLDNLNAPEVDGDVLNSLRSTLTKTASTADPAARPWITQLVNKVVDISTDGDPALKKQLNEARKNYKNLNVALNSWDSTTNSFNPVKLEGAVKQNSGYGLRSYARGNAGDLGELAQIGKTFMPSIGGSQTAPIATSVGAGLGMLGGVIEPTMALATGAGVLTNRAIQSGINTNPAVVRSMLAAPQTLPAITQQELRNALASGMLGGYIGSQ